jgi:hypothetical protein
VSVGSISDQVGSLDGHVRSIDIGVAELRVGFSQGLGRLDERIDARHEADETRFAMLARHHQVEQGFDRILGDLRGELITAVTSQTRTLVLGLIGAMAVYGGVTVTVLR